jgi:hypothetical protein
MKESENFPKHDFEHQIKEDKKLYIEFSRILHSVKCIKFYIFLIGCSILIFLYSIFAYFFDLNEFILIICESILMIIITADMFMRIYVTVRI